ncbi:hypothetical protein ACIP4Y_03565 [Streptomyces sp. NPDC088810]|uniref:hypothetical protein n=1 Tax=Streptomyces sp. NPDC088810 TaxID=3365904 RepID=UPI003827194A
MTDRTNGPGGDRHRTERFTRPQGDEWTPEQESPDRDEWSPGDAFPAHRSPRKPRPDEHLPGEPTPNTPRTSPENTGGRLAGGRIPGGSGSARLTGESAGDRMTGESAGGRLAGGGSSDRLAGESAGGRLTDESAGDRLTGESARGPAPGADGRGRASGVAGSGREGLTGDDRTPEDTPQPPPGPAGVREGESAPGREHGSEGLRPGTEGLGPDTAGTGRPDADAVGEDGVMPDDGLGAPAVAAASGREARTANGRGADSWPAAPATAGAHSGTGAPLLPHEETDRWERRLREVAVGFVDDPREAVEEADRALEEITTRFTEAVTRRRRTLRMSWQGTEERGPAAETDTEQLRLALRDYRELAGRLLHG